MKITQKNIKPGYQMQNNTNNHRILCTEASNNPNFIGFIGKTLVHTYLTMDKAMQWLYADPCGKDSVCEVCNEALFKFPVITAAEGKLFCCNKCARAWKRNKLMSELDNVLDEWEIEATEAVGSDICCGQNNGGANNE